MFEGYLIGDDGETSIWRLERLLYRCSHATLTEARKVFIAEAFV